MKVGKTSKMKRIWVGSIGFLMIVVSLIGNFGLIMSPNVVAEPQNTSTQEETAPDNNESEEENNESEEENNPGSEEEGSTNEANQVVSAAGDGCKASLGALSWFICPLIEITAKGVDKVYGMIEGWLQLDPVSFRSDSAIQRVWEYVRIMTNAVFIMFFLVVIYSQITGVGISNYGIKKVLPKIVVVAVLINLSFLICSLAIDVSNVIGNGLRGLFSSIEESVLNSTEVAVNNGASMEDAYKAIVLGSTLAVGGGAIIIESGLIWMLIPTALGAFAAVGTGLITIALRQAVVALLVMISPLAFVAYMLPNTEIWFKRWKDVFMQMLVFFPAFSLLYGASSLASFAIMMTAIANKDGFWLILALGVQTLPLFYSVKLMQMSNTFLGSINAKLQGLAATPLATNRAWADSHRQLTKQKTLASGITPSARLVQFLSNQKVAREEETNELASYVKLRGQAHGVRRNYNSKGVPTAEGEAAYKRQALSMIYTLDIERHKNNMNKGLGSLEAVEANAGAIKKARLKALDVENVVASDRLKMEASRGAKIEYDNTVGYYERVKKAMYANADDEAIRNGKRKEHEFHGVLQDGANLERFKEMTATMEGNINDTSFIVADAAHTFGAQSSIVKGKFGDHFKYIEATQDIVNEMNRLTRNKEAAKYIDPIVAGLRTLNMRGDTDLVMHQIDNLLDRDGFQIGSHALQEISGFCMFDVKGNDPTLRRFGKYINLQTAQMFNEGDNRRTKRDISFKEYIDGGYVARDEDGSIIYESDGKTPKFIKTKGAATLLKGTSFKDMERTAMRTLTQLIRNSSATFTIDENGEKKIESVDVKDLIEKEGKIWDAIMPNIISDQFAFLSGSEQIIALGKAITGVDFEKDKRGFDFDGIFTKDAAEKLTQDEKESYIKSLLGRTGKFLEGHVPIQIARAKSDMLEAIKTQFVLSDALAIDTEDGKQDPRMDDSRKRLKEDEYKRLEESHFVNAKKKFQNSFKDDAKKGFAKMYDKGFQGESKQGLVDLLDPEELYKKYYPEEVAKREVRKKQYGQQEGALDKQKQYYDDYDEDDDGMPIGPDGGTGYGHEPIHNSTSNQVTKVYKKFEGDHDMGNVESFWERTRDVLYYSDEMAGAEGIIDSLEQEIKVMTSVDAAYKHIMQKLFGWYGNE